jgi:crotonobetaine/carnitine-CoA ligase
MPITTNVELPATHPFLQADIPWLLRRTAEAHPDRPCLIWEPFEGESRTWTYAEARSWVRRTASGLAARGVKPRDPVILHLENSPESILTWLACAELGAVAVTTNARAAGPELAYFAEKSGAVGIITQPAFADLARKHLPDIGWIAVAEPGDERLLGDEEIAPRAADPAHPFSVQFTSGTTARPKGVLWTHANGLWGSMVNARHFGLRCEDVTLIHGPLFHTVAQAWQALSSLWVGAAMVVQPKFSASRFWDVTVRNGVTWCTGGGFSSQALADQATPEHKLRFLFGGISLPSVEPFGVYSMGAHGMTELITHSVFNDPYGAMDLGSIGRPAPEYQVRVVHEDGSPVKPGELGELQVKGVRGLSVFAEYLNDPEATASSCTDDGYFRTSDLLRLREDGAFQFADRLKDMLKVGGENVAASEIEAVARRVAGVQEVAVVAGPHKMLAEIPIAFVIPTPDAPPDLRDRIIALCRAELADFKVPRDVRLVEDFPRSLLNKVAKVELRRLLQAEANA